MSSTERSSASAQASASEAKSATVVKKSQDQKSAADTKPTKKSKFAKFAKFPKKSKSSESTKKSTKKSAKTPKFTVKNRPQHRRRHVIYAIFSIVIGVGLISTAYYFLKWKAEIDITDAEITDAQQSSTISQVDDDLGTEVISSGESSDSPYWYLLEEPLVNVDFSDLKQTNSETVGWIQVPGTRIDYPFVQTSDNDFYLSHSLDRSGNSAGWVFLDYRNRSNLTGNQNSIVYAHGRVDGSMFGTLKNVLESTWLDEPSYHLVKTSTVSEDALWQVFSVYRTPVTTDYLQTDFATQDDYANFLNTLQGRSQYNFGATLSRNDHIITLSTCIGSDERVVLHAKLIKLTRH